MSRHLFIIVALVSVLTGLANAAPPVEGMPTQAQRVKAGCKYAKLVVIAQVVNLRVQPQNGRELQSGDLKLVEVIKGVTGEVPKTISNFKHIPRSTDSFKEDLEDQMTCLIFMAAPAAPGWESLIPRFRYDWQTNQLTDKEFRSAVLLARSACQQ